jgi:hypothetical protein
MRKLAVCFTLLLLVPAFAISSRAQQVNKSADAADQQDAAKPAHFYRLDYVLEELDSAGKPVNSRSFTTTVSTARTRSGSFTVGSKVPVVSGAQSAKDDPSGLQFQYIDIGTKITANDIHEDGDHLSLNLRAEVSSLATPKVLGGVAEPVIRQNVWSGDVLLPIGKATIVFKSDSIEDKGSMQLEVTATSVD